MPFPLPLVAPMPGGPAAPPTVVFIWFDGMTRNPVSFGSESPAIIPLSIPNPPFFGEVLGNTAGQWLFAVVSWRQDAGQPGVLLYPSTVSISDDADNFWIPLAVTPPNAGIIRTAVWMAPAARAAERVFISPTAWQAAVVVTLFQMQAVCPWYQIAANVTAYTNQGMSVTLNQAAAEPGVLTIGVIAFNNLGASLTTSAPGWNPVTWFGSDVAESNGANTTGDLKQKVWLSTDADSLSASSSTIMDWSGITVSIHGVADVLPFPYQVPVENWPAVITEIAADPALNANPLILNGATDWTATGGTVSAVNWPAWNPNPYYQTLITQSLQLAPSGTAGTVSITSGRQPVSAVSQYNALAYVYSTAAQSSGVSASVFISWSAGTVPVSVTSGSAVALAAGAWTPLTLSAPVYPAAAAANGAVGIQLTSTSGNVPAADIIFAGYCAFGGSDGYENLTPDQITWSDVSSYNWAHGPMQVDRGIQFEQQSLEAGTASFTLDNTAYPFMFGNTEAGRWPNIGDTDVPVRIRLVNPASITPYTVLFSGYTDDIDFGIDSDSYQAWAQFTCSDAWSRLTQQLVVASLEEILVDDPAGLWACSGSGANQAPGAVTPVQTVTSQYGTVSLSSSGSVSTGYGASFGGGAIQLPGSQGAQCWQSAISGTVPAVNFGVALGYFPALSSGDALPPVAGGVTLEFWMNPVSDYTTQPATILTLVACWSGTGIMWEITLNNTGVNFGVASVTVYDKVTGAGTTTSLGVVEYITFPAGTPGLTWFFAVTFTQSSLTVTVNPTQLTFSSTTVTCNLAAVMTGFTWGGNAGPVYQANSDGNLGFMSNLAVANIALFPYIVPASRITQHALTAGTAWPSEIDTWRLARVASYAGFVPVLGMRGVDLEYQIALDYFVNDNIPDVDPVTAITDTSGQVVSSYFTNIASSTLAAMFMNGPGALIYRRRLEWYDRPIAQYAIGDSPGVNLVNPLNTGTLGTWFAENGATLSTSGSPGAAAGAQFSPYCAVFIGNGSTANPQIAWGSFITPAAPVTPGAWYSLSCWVFCPQGWATGAQLYVNYWTAGFGSFVGQSFTPDVVLPAGSLVYLQAPVSQAPANAALGVVAVAAIGTPASSVHFYVANFQFTQVPPVTAGGSSAVAPEAPALTDAKLSSDRAQLYNQAVLNQSGTNTLTTFSGSSLNFSPSSGVVVIIDNAASENARGSIPYTATIYLNNTQQALPYQLDEASIEDVGNWIVQTLGQPLFRPLQVTLTPVATPPSLNTGLLVEVGDTVTFRRRFPGAPEMQIVTYCSKLSHEIDQSSGTWNVVLELSPLPQAFVLACDDVVHGVLTSGNYFGW